MRRLKPTRFLPAFAATVAASLLGCGDGLDFDNDSFESPLIAIASAPATCAAAGSGSILFNIEDVSVAQNFPGSAPQNRLDVSGTVNGLAMGDSVQILLLPYDGDCPLLGSAQATLTGTDFTARIGFGDRVAFRVALVAHGGMPNDIDCAAGGSCLSTAAGSFSAVSEMIEVRLQ